jgi:hypothetical protein
MPSERTARLGREAKLRFDDLEAAIKVRYLQGAGPARVKT